MTESEYQALLLRPGVARANAPQCPHCGERGGHLPGYGCDLGEVCNCGCIVPGQRHLHQAHVHTDTGPQIVRQQCDDEAELHNQISDWCRERGWLAFHGSMATQTHRTKGEPDFVIFTDDKRVLCVECKTRTGKLRPEQLAIQAHLRKLGHGYYVVRSLAEFMDVAIPP